MEITNYTKSKVLQPKICGGESSTTTSSLSQSNCHLVIDPTSSSLATTASSLKNSMR